MSTINFQGFLQSGETESPFNGTISVRFYLHTQDEGPPDGIPLWEEFYSQLNVKDGIFFARLGVLNPLTRDLFRSDRPVQLSMRIVRFGTGEAASYIGPIAIDGNAYSVSSISKSGSDSKEGTVKIIPLAVDDPSSFGLLEIDSDDPETLHKFEIRWDKTGFPSADIGRGLVVQYPQNMELNSYAPSSSEDRLPWDSGQFLIDFQEEVPDISVYIVNGTVRLGGNLTLSPLEFDDFKLPGDLKAHNANVTGDIKVNDLIATGPGDGSGGIIKGTRLEYCAGPPDCQPKPGSSEAKFSNYGIDPFPAEDESKSTLINSLEIRSKLDDTGKLLFETDRGEFLIDGPLQTSQTSFVHVSGADGFVYASALRSPFPSKDKNGNISRPYVIAPDKISVLDSLVLITDTTNRNRDPKYPAFNEISKDRDALRSPLNAFSAFDLISTIPICSGVPTIAPYSAHCQETWCMALRPDYCAQDPNPKIRDKYKDIDPCHGISFNQLKGYRLNCRPEEIISDHPNLQTDENDPAKGAKYFVTSHIHQLLNNATAETLIEIINAAQAGQTLNKRLLPTDTVNLNLPNTLTGTNVFETVHSAHQMVASIDQDIDAYLGSFIVGLAQPARLGSLRTHISQIDFLKDLNTVGTLNLHAGSTILHTSADPARPQRHEVQKDVDVGGKLIVHSSVFETSGDLFFEDIDLDPANGPYMNFIGSVNLEGNLRFRPEEFQTNRNLLGLDQTIASKFIDLDDQSFSVDPDQYSTLSFLSVTGSFRVSKPSRVQGDLVIQRDLYAIESLESASFLKASTLSDLDDPHYFIDPPGTSRIRGLVVEESLTIQGDFTVDSTLRVTGVVDVSGSFFSSGKLEVQNPSSSVLSTYLEDSSDPKYKVDPTNQSLLRELGLNSSSNVGGDLSVDGQMEIQNTMTHEGSARVVGQVQSQDRILSPKLLDFEDSTYLADPSLQSRFHALELIKSLNVTNSTSLSSSLTILGELRSNSSLKILTDLIIGEDLTAFSSLQIYHTSGLGFSVDELGNATGRSITLDENAFAQDLEIGGNLNLSGTPIEFNADSSFEKLTISTHSLISRRSSTSLGFESAASIDKDGNLELHHELFLEDEMIISENIRFHDGNSPDRMVLSIVNSALTSVHIGLDGQKDLNLSGLSSKTLSVPTATFYRFEDSDNSAYHLDPASSTRFQILEIEHSLRTEESLTAPYLMDLQNLYLVDPSDKSRLLSLEVLQNTTAQQIQAASLRIDSQNLLPGSTLVEAGSMRITKGATLGLTGQTYLDGSNFLIGSSNGIRIADNRSLGSGSTITYGELNSLISGANADHLHRHDLLGGVEIYNIARQDIDNLTGPTPQTTSSTKGLFGKNLFTYPGLTISIRPVSHQTQSALFSVKDSSGSAVVQAFASGLVEAVTFQGAGQGLSNISGSGTSNDAISDGTIASDKIQNNSLGGSVFATQLLQLSHLKDRALEAKHFLERSLDANVIEDGSLVGENFRDDSIENLHLTSATIDTTLIENGSISSYHIKTRTISASHISPSTLDNRVLQSASVLGDRIIDGSIQARHVSTGAVNTTRITTNELQGSLFEDNSISTVKIQTAAIQTSSFASLSLTYSDFATNSILSSKVASSSITGSNFASGTLDSSALAANSINWIKISSLSLQAVDISTLAIQSSSEATQHKVNLAAINSDKILDREVEGSHFIADSILLSHLAANAVSSTHFQTQSILGEDILTGTLSGLKINDLSIQTAQIGDQAITKSEIASSALDSNSIANLTLSSESFQDGSIIRSKLASDTVASLHLRNSSLLDKDFALNALTQSKWKSDTINTIKIATGAITLQKLATGAVRSQEVSYRAVLTSAISASAILSTHILSNQVTQSKIANFTILVEDIGDAQIDVRIVAPDSILTTNILDLSVFSPHISTNALSGAILSEDAITRAKVLSDQIDSAQILDGSIFSGNFSTSAILSNHIDLDTLSSRVLGTAQVLTTHVAEGAIGNSRIQTDQINSRILTQSSVIARHILTHTLGSSKCASSILTDEHFQDGAISPSKIATDSLVETVFLSYTLLGIHVIPSSLTSGSLEDLAITSSQISNDTISGEHILELSLTDLELATDALDNSVFQIDAISSPNVLDESILSQDIATGALLSTHIAAGTLLDEHFAPSSILTTHIANFTIGSGVLQSASVTQAKLATRSPITKGFHALADIRHILDTTTFILRPNSSFVLFDPGGIFELETLNPGFPKLLDDLQITPSLARNKSNRIWLSDGSSFYGSFHEGSDFRQLRTFNSSILDIFFEDENHGVILTDGKTYLSYDGGETSRLVRSGSGFYRAYSRDNLSKLWVASQNGSLAYSTDGFATINSLALPISASPLSDNALFTMIDGNTGYMVNNSHVYKTSDNWSNSTSSSSLGTVEFSFTAQDG
ncbi:S-layer family protein, partial [bacterium]|nr:S-layer family protein [bacterium]